MIQLLESECESDACTMLETNRNNKRGKGRLSIRDDYGHKRARDIMTRSNKRERERDMRKREEHRRSQERRYRQPTRFDETLSLVA